ncbi:MAG: hypothetical protein WCL21_13180 [Mariniphaga sp.]
MGKLTSEQVNELADYFLAMAQALGDYRHQNVDHLLETKNQEVKELQAAIRKYADDLYTLSASLVLDDVQGSLAAIGEITNQIKSTYAELKDVQKAINIANSVINLVKAIIEKNPTMIGQILADLARN